MMHWLWIIPAFPFAGFFILAMTGPRLSRRTVAVVGTGSVAASAVSVLLTAVGFASGGATHPYTQTLWLWWQVNGFQPMVGLYVDAPAVVMMLIVTVVGFFIHLYSTKFMIEDEGYSRFFAYMNLFVAFMLVLVMADNLVLLYLGWEGVGLCSYLLIGFWYKNPENGLAARKAFIVTRIGDTAMALGLFLLFTRLDTLNIQDLMIRASQTWPSGSFYPTAAALLLLGGAVGKSAQLPLQTWLPDAMAGPSPVSALIHAATMVTAGVYLIIRTHLLFILAPAVMSLVAIIGAITLLLAGFSALTQRDIKRVLAYSTISQIGYMFLALGVGAWSAGLFHLMTHAFFKALLFLAAGAVIQATGEEHDMFKMGGLRRQLPVTFWTFLIGSGALSGVPLITAGYYSKDQILWLSYASERGNALIWMAALIGALLTSLYTFRLVFRVFFGTNQTPVVHRPGWTMKFPLVVLAFFSLTAGCIELPRTMGDLFGSHLLGNVHLFSNFVEQVLPSPVLAQGREYLEGPVSILTGVVCLAGIGIVYLFILGMPQWADRLTGTGPGKYLSRFWFSGWGFDTLYETVLVRPFTWLASVNRNDGIDKVFNAVALINRAGYRGLNATQSGLIRTYVLGIGAGAVIIIGLVVLL